MACVVSGMWCASGLALDPSLLLTQYSQRTWTREDGLPQSSVQAITQDADGYLWVGTQQGLARFDGVRFVPVELHSADGRIDGYLHALYSDSYTVWAGTTMGLYRRTKGRFVEVLTDGGSSLGTVNTIFRDSASRLWIATLDGLFNEHGGRAVLYEGPGVAELKAVHSIAESPDSRLCFANGRIFCLKDGVFSEVPFTSESAAGTRSELIAFDSSGVLWSGSTGRGMLFLENGQWRRWETADSLPNEYVLALLVDREDGVWFGCGASGIARISRHGLEVLAGPKGQTGSEIRALLEDREGNLWIGTNSDGLIRLSAGLFTPFSVAEGLRERSVNTVLEDHEGVIWIGTAGGGLHRLTRDGVGVLGAADGLPSDEIMCLALDGRGRVWVGTAGAGVLVRDGDRFVPVEGTGRVVFALHEDLQGRMWAGGIGAVMRWEGERFLPVEALHRINAAAIMSRSGGEIWFANGRGGVAVWHDGEVTRLGEEQGFPGDMTVALYEDEAGGVWIGAHLGGLTYVDTNAKDNLPFRFTASHGLCDNSVFSIVEDEAGRLWMSSNRGVFTVARQQLEAVARGQATRVDCRLFGEVDGMRSAECNGGQQPSAWQDRAGRIWFATVDGVARIDPRRIAGVEPPRPVIEGLATGSTTILLDEGGIEPVLPPSRRELSIHYTALTLTMPEQVRFRYRLEGLEQDWVEAGERRVAYYTNLPPRRYRFHVQTRLPDSVWSETATIGLRLQPRFFETWWFLALALLALVSLATGAHRGRVAMLRNRQQKLQALVAERTRELEEVNSTLELRIEEGIEALRESDRMAAYGHLMAGVAHEVRHPIFTVRAAAHLLAQKLAHSEDTNEELDILARETERMSRLVDDLLELGRPRELELQPWRPEELIDEALATLADHPDTHPRLLRAVDESLPAVLADRPALIQVLVNLLHNACRHAVGASQVTVGAELCRPDGTVHLTVADDGAGIPLSDQPKIFDPFFSGAGGTGLGLAIASRLVREHGGRITVDSTPGEGTVLKVALAAAE